MSRFKRGDVHIACNDRLGVVYHSSKGQIKSAPADHASVLRDALEIMTVFSARLYGSRSKKNKKILEGVAKAVEDAENDTCAQNQA